MSVSTLAPAADRAALDLASRCRGTIVNRCYALHVDRPQESDLEDIASDALLRVLSGLKTGSYTPEKVGSLVWLSCRAALADWIDQRTHNTTGGDCFETPGQEPMTCPECLGTGDTYNHIAQHHEHCDRCNGEGEIVEPLPQCFLSLALGSGGKTGEALQLTAYALSRGMTIADTARVLRVSRSTLYRRIDALKDRLDLFNPEHEDQNGTQAR